MMLAFRFCFCVCFGYFGQHSFDKWGLQKESCYLLRATIGLSHVLLSILHKNSGWAAVKFKRFELDCHYFYIFVISSVVP